MSHDSLPSLLRRHAALIGPVVPLDLDAASACRLDLTAANPVLASADLRDTKAFEALLQQLLGQAGARVGLGGYLEDRIIYRRSSHFGAAAEKRSVHLGVDLWLPAQTPVLAPLPGRVHSFRDNAGFGDYGPTIILEHELAGQPFYALYGHLSRASLSGLVPGQAVSQGQPFAWVGPYPENGDWPAHLHFQLLTDLLGQSGDFPGVCTPAQQQRFARICPDPNLILKSRVLGY
ncbi:MAG: peptidoglycan DD-metalloendopeptidase family protein [Adhaeribacter sp.]